MTNYKSANKRNSRQFDLHKHPFVVPVVTFIVLSFGTMIAGVLLGAQTLSPTDLHVVQLSTDGNKQNIPTRAGTVKDFLGKVDIKLNDGDVVEPAQDSMIDVDDFRINVYRARPVTIFDGDKRIQALSAATTARSVAAQAGIDVYPEDNLNQTVSNDVLKDQVLGEKLTIVRATPTNINLYGTLVEVRTHAKTVGGLLKDKNIVVADGDTVTPALDTPISSDIQVFVTRFGTQIATVEEVVPNEVEIIEDSTLSFGTQAIRQKGSPGKKLVTYVIEQQNGVEVSRKLIQEVRILEPVAQITARGKAVSIPSDRAALMRSAGIAESDFPFVQYIINHENGMWCATRWQGQNFCPPYYEEKFPGAESHTSTGYGMCQSTPGIKMATAGNDWRTNPVTQLKWCSNYASRYGGWQGSYEVWTRRQSEGRGWW